MNDNITDAATSALDRAISAIEAAVTNYGEDVVNLALKAVQIDAIRELIFAGAFIALGVAALAGAWRMVIKCRDMACNTEAEEIIATCLGLGALITAIFGATVILVNLGGVLDPTLWLAAFGAPEIKIAVDALRNVGLLQ